MRAPSRRPGPGEEPQTPAGGHLPILLLVQERAEPPAFTGWVRERGKVGPFQTEMEASLVLKDDIIEALAGGPAPKRLLYARVQKPGKRDEKLGRPEPSGAFNRDLKQLKMEGLIRSTREGYIRRDDKDHCTACGSELTDQNCCAEEGCLSPIQRTVCGRCGTEFDRQLTPAMREIRNLFEDLNRTPPGNRGVKERD